MTKKNDEMILRGYKGGDEKQISHLFFNNFPDTLDPELICKTWLWQFQNSFSKDSGVSVAELSDEIVAHYAVMWFPMCYQDRRISGAVSTATVTDKKARGKGLFTKLAKKVFTEIETEGCKLVFGFPNSQSIRGFIKKLEWFEIAKFPLLIKPVNFFPFLAKFLGDKPLTTFFSFFINKVYRFSFRFFNGWGQDGAIRIVTDVEGFTEEFNKIWINCFASSKIAVARESSY
ncbi:MAG: GNAT family N-acetyltransferase, partial [Desulfobacteraceae bacterium]|nr:GNAT family N-acetyltransferase [Desulfobacteraceae bacterium]